LISLAVYHLAFPFTPDLAFGLFNCLAHFFFGGRWKAALAQAPFLALYLLARQSVVWFRMLSVWCCKLMLAFGVGASACPPPCFRVAILNCWQETAHVAIYFFPG